MGKAEKIMVVGLGETGKPLLEVISRHYKTGGVAHSAAS